MTGGTFFLFWIGKLAPATPLRAKVASGWDQISIRAQEPRSEPGFYHFRIDPSGTLYESTAWSNQWHARGNEGTIQVVISCRLPGLRLTADQSNALSQIVSNIRQRYDIPADRVRVETPQQLASLPDDGRF